MKTFSFAVAIAAALVLTGCASSSTPTPEVTTMSVSPSPSATPSATPTEAAEAGTRENPLAPGTSRKISPTSMWSVGASAPTERAEGYIVLPLRIELDWDAGRKQAEGTGVDMDSQGVDPWASLTVEFVSAAGRSYTTMDNYDVTVPNQLYDVGTVYPPATTVDANVPVSVPNDQVDGGSWVVRNSKGDSVFISLG